MLKLLDTIPHSIDFDDTCYYVNTIDDIASNYVQETWVKNEMSYFLKDEPPNKPNEVVEEDCNTYSGMGTL